MEYEGYTIHIIAILRGEAPDSRHDHPTVFAYVDVSGGHPVVSNVELQAPPGVSAWQVWDGLDLDQLATTLPKVGTALQPPAPPAEQAAQPRRAKKTAAKPGKKTATRRQYNRAPDNVLEVYEQQYGRSAEKMGKALNVPARTVKSWVFGARKKKQRTAELDALPIVDPDSKPAPLAQAQRVSAPPDILELFAKEFNSDYDALVAEYGIPKTRAYSWVNDARKKAKNKAAKQAELDTLPAHDPEDGPKEEHAESV